MTIFNSHTASVTTLEPEKLDQFFSKTRQEQYVARLLGRAGVTRRRAEYFVRLWAYLSLKQVSQADQLPPKPLTELMLTDNLISCTHREAAELFYGDRDRGSDRAAGMMIDQLAALGLLEKRFDGQTLCLKIHPLPELLVPANSDGAFHLQPDHFNPRTDAIPIAGLIRQTYAMAADDSTIVPQKMARILRQWANEYPTGFRVLRRSDNLNPVGAAILYPVASESEDIFSRSPNKSFYLTSNLTEDPVQKAQPGDPDCMAIYIRAWIIDIPYLKKPYICQFLKDTQATLTTMQADFPNVCDLYSPVIHPLHEDMRRKLGFQKTGEEHRPFYWSYLSLDRYLELDIDQALSDLKA